MNKKRMTAARVNLRKRKRKTSTETKVVLEMIKVLPQNIVTSTKARSALIFVIIIRKIYDLIDLLPKMSALRRQESAIYYIKLP